MDSQRWWGLTVTCVEDQQSWVHLNGDAAVPLLGVAALVGDVLGGPTTAYVDVLSCAPL